MIHFFQSMFFKSRHCSFSKDQLYTNFLPKQKMVLCLKNVPKQFSVFLSTTIILYNIIILYIFHVSIAATVTFLSAHCSQACLQPQPIQVRMCWYTVQLKHRKPQSSALCLICNTAGLTQLTHEHLFLILPHPCTQICCLAILFFVHYTQQSWRAASYLLIHLKSAAYFQTGDGGPFFTHTLHTA